MTAVWAFLKLVPWWLYAALVAIGIIAAQHFALTSARAERDDYATQVATANARIESMLNTAKLQRELTTDANAAAQRFQEASQDADEQSRALSADLADKRKWLQVHGQCVSVAGKSGTDTGSADAATIRLDPAAERNYLSLASGIKQQYAQIIGLQERIKSLESKCKIGG